jgi:hypothetical protein
MRSYVFKSQAPILTQQPNPQAPPPAVKEVETPVMTMAMEKMRRLTNPTAGS